MNDARRAAHYSFINRILRKGLVDPGPDRSFKFHQQGKSTERQYSEDEVITSKFYVIKVVQDLNSYTTPQHNENGKYAYWTPYDISEGAWIREPVLRFVDNIMEANQFEFQDEALRAMKDIYYKSREKMAMKLCTVKVTRTIKSDYIIKE